MKKRLILILLCTIVTVSMLSITIIVRKIREEAQQKASVTALPSFSGQRGLDNFKVNTPSVFIAFHPECEHCQYEVKSINERHKDLENVNIVMFTVANDSMTKEFSKQYGLDSLKNVHVIADTTREMERLFNVKSIPSIFIYNAQKQLVKEFKGETKIEAIIKYAVSDKQ